MVVQVKDAGGSESRAVMGRIGVPALTRKGADFRHGLDGWEDVQSLGSLETLDGANRTDRRAGADDVVRD